MECAYDFASWEGVVLNSLSPKTEVECWRCEAFRSWQHGYFETWPYGTVTT